MKKTLLIKNAFLIDPDEIYTGKNDLLIQNGRIHQIGSIKESAESVLDARGLHLAPGLVDMHVHLRDPGQTWKETIETGAAAALAGGVTSVAAMPNTTPVADSPAVLAYELKKAKQTGVHLYPIAAVSKGQNGEEQTDFKALVESGAVAFSDDGHPVKDAARMLKAMCTAYALGKKVISHCEDKSLAKNGIMSEESGRRLGFPGVPAVAETVQAAREIVLAEAAGVPVHIAHVSSRHTVAILRDAKKRGVPVTCETCPHYFSLDDSLLSKRDADYRMNPPLQGKEDVRAVIAGLVDGTIDAIVTDHVPHAAEEKADFEKAPNGVVGLETSLAAGVTYLVKPGYLTLAQLIKKMSTVPASLLGIDAGHLTIGARADLVLFDPDKIWTVYPEKLHSKSHNTPYKNKQLYGSIQFTISDGNVRFSNC